MPEEKAVKRVRLALSSQVDCSRFLAKIIRQVYAGELSPSVGGRLGYLANVLKNCLDTTTPETPMVTERRAVLQRAHELVSELGDLQRQNIALREQLERAGLSPVVKHPGEDGEDADQQELRPCACAREDSVFRPAIKRRRTGRCGLARARERTDPWVRFAGHARALRPCACAR